MQDKGVESIVRMIIGGIFGVAVVSFIAKDGQGIGSFLQATGNAFGSFAKQVQAT